MSRVSILAVALCAAVASAAEPSARPLDAEIARARRATPRVFAALAALKQRVSALDAHKRGRLAPLTPSLKALGPAGLLPMLDELKSGAALPGWTPTAKVAWRVGLLEAVGGLRDPRAEEALRSAVEKGTDPDEVRAAANAAGKLGTPGAVAALVPLAEESGPRQLAVVEGLGECRRLAAAEALARVLAGSPDEALARAAVKALGETGSAWAWQTPQLAARPEKAEVRAAAAKALVATFADRPGEIRRAAETALLQVDPPDAGALIAAAKEKAAAADQAELDRLAGRLAHNPLRGQGR